MSRLICRHCGGVLPKRDARCRTCGWAADYGDGSGIKRLERERLLGVGFIVVAVTLAFALAIAMGWLRAL